MPIYGVELIVIWVLDLSRIIIGLIISGYNLEILDKLCTTTPLNVN